MSIFGKMEVPEELRGRWAEVRAFVLREFAAYLADATDSDIQPLPTRCSPWTVSDVTAHLAATFARFNAMLAPGRHGDFRPPFPRHELSRENLRAVREFGGDPAYVLHREAAAFVAEASDLDEVIPHQLGPIPVGLQLHFALNELVLHHDDVAHAVASSYRPDEEAVAALALMWERALGGAPLGRGPLARRS